MHGKVCLVEIGYIYWVHAWEGVFGGDWVCHVKSGPHLEWSPGLFRHHIWSPIYHQKWLRLGFGLGLRLGLGLGLGFRLGLGTSGPFRTSKTSPHGLVLPLFPVPRTVFGSGPYFS